MIPQKTRAFKKFSFNLFHLGRIYSERKKAIDDLDDFLIKMKKSIIRMELKFSDIDKLRTKLDIVTRWERSYAKFFKTEDGEMNQLRNEIKSLEDKLSRERQEKEKLLNENSEKIRLLTESMGSVKNKLKELHLDKARRQHRFHAIEKKIKEKFDHNYLGS